MLGQAVVKFVAGAVRFGAVNWQRVVLSITLTLVPGLVPCLIVITLLLRERDAPRVGSGPS